MISRLRTTEDIENKLLDLDKKLRLSSKASIMRLAIACSLRMSGDPRDKGDRRMHYDIRNQNGLDYQRQTIFGQMEGYYRALMVEFAQNDLQDDEFFPELTYYHSRANNGRASKANGRPINPTYLGRKISREEIVHRQFDSGNGTRYYQSNNKRTTECIRG